MWWDAIDTVSSKLLLIENAKKFQVPIISCMGTGNKLDPFRFEIADISKTVCVRWRKPCAELRKRGIRKVKVLFSKEKPVPMQEQAAETKAAADIGSGKHFFVPAVAGLQIAGEVVRDLCRFKK